MGMNILPGKKCARQFNISSNTQRAEYERIMNDMRCQIVEKSVTTSKLGEAIVYIEYIDLGKRQND